jgi:hypothetical protein
MAKAVRSLSPKQIQERIQQHRLAVMVLARRSARKAVEAKLKGQGINPMRVPPCEIMALTNAYLAEHRAFFIVEAKQAIATRPAFARWRLPSANISSDAQKQSEPKSTISAVQMLGAK